jgi:hypothetical protein
LRGLFDVGRGHAADPKVRYHGEVTDWLSDPIRLNLAIVNRQAAIMLGIASEFGFTPASRSRISAPPQDQLPLFDTAEPEG